jgi:hypothetical protein
LKILISAFFLFLNCSSAGFAQEALKFCAAINDTDLKVNCLKYHENLEKNRLAYIETLVTCEIGILLEKNKNDQRFIAQMQLSIRSIFAESPKYTAEQLIGCEALKKYNPFK